MAIKGHVDGMISAGRGICSNEADQLPRARKRTREDESDPVPQQVMQGEADEPKAKSPADESGAEKGWRPGVGPKFPAGI